MYMSKLWEVITENMEGITNTETMTISVKGPDDLIICQRRIRKGLEMVIVCDVDDDEIFLAPLGSVGETEEFSIIPLTELDPVVSEIAVADGEVYCNIRFLKDKKELLKLFKFHRSLVQSPVPTEPEPEVVLVKIKLSDDYGTAQVEAKPYTQGISPWTREEAMEEISKSLVKKPTMKGSYCFNERTFLLPIVCLRDLRALKDIDLYVHPTVDGFPSVLDEIYVRLEWLPSKEVFSLEEFSLGGEDFGQEGCSPRRFRGFGLQSDPVRDLTLGAVKNGKDIILSWNWFQAIYKDIRDYAAGRREIYLLELTSDFELLSTKHKDHLDDRDVLNDSDVGRLLDVLMATPKQILRVSSEYFWDNERMIRECLERRNKFHKFDMKDFRFSPCIISEGLKAHDSDLGGKGVMYDPDSSPSSLKLLALVAAGHFRYVYCQTKHSEELKRSLEILTGRSFKKGGVVLVE